MIQVLGGTKVVKMVYITTLKMGIMCYGNQTSRDVFKRETACMLDGDFCSNHESKIVPPTSEWLEDTLIDLYLCGYSKSSVTADDVTVPLEADDGHDLIVLADVHLVCKANGVELSE